MFNWLLEFISEYGLLAIFIIVTLEYACFPLPSEVVLPTAGAISYTLHINFGYVLLLCTIAGLIGSMICYSLGFFGGNPILSKITNKYPSTKKGIEASTKTYEKYSNFSVCFSRIIPLCRTYISFIAGISKQNIFKFLFYSTIGIIAWNAVLLYLGYMFYDNIDYVANLINDYKLMVIIIALLFLIIFVVIYQYKKHKK